MARQYLQSFLATVARLVAGVFTPTALRVRLNDGREAWFYPHKMLVLPIAAGGDGTEDDGADDDAADDKDTADDADDSDDDADKGAADDDADDDSDDSDDDGKFGTDVEATKREARKHERRAKAAEKKAADLQKELDKVKGQSKSAQEKALEKAVEDAKAEVRSEYEKRDRANRLEATVTRLSLKGVKSGDGDDAETIKFADSEDVLLYIQKKLESGDLDAEDIFGEDGKVDTAELTSALVDLAEAKPHWLAGGDDGAKGKKSAKGSSDAGRGKGAGKEPDAMSPDDHLKALQGR